MGMLFPSLIICLIFALAKRKMQLNAISQNVDVEVQKLQSNVITKENQKQKRALTL